MLLTLLVAAPEIKVSKSQSGTLVVPDDYPTIAAAIGDAINGDTIFVKKGTYDGPINQTIVINKTISLIGEDPESTILNLHSAWIIKEVFIGNPLYGYDYSMEILANDVEVSGFTINGKGILVTRGNNTQVSNNTLNISLFLRGSNETATQNNSTRTISCGPNSTITKNYFIGGGIDIRGGSFNTVYDNVVTDGSSIGILTNQNRIFNNTVNNCKSGVAISLQIMSFMVTYLLTTLEDLTSI